MNAIFFTSSWRAAAAFSKEGWVIINDGSESPMVYSHSLTGCEVPVSSSDQFQVEIYSHRDIHTQWHADAPCGPYCPLGDDVIIAIGNEESNPALFQIARRLEVQFFQDELLQSRCVCQ